eukprot:999717-Rhodomonas_salina.1
MAHVPISKLAKMSSLVMCALCDEAKAKHQPFPDASMTQYENEDDLMTWDLVDVSENWKSICGF